MSYSHGHPIAAADYNALAGLTGTAAADASAATAKAGYLWGVGYGDRGYGQSTPALTGVSAGGIVASQDTLRTVLSNLCSWQNTSTSLLPPSGSLSAGASVRAYPTSETPSIPDLLALLDTNRLNYQVGNMTLTSSAASTTRSSTWDSYVQAGFSIDFGSENNARFFFNTGGELRLAFAHPNTSTSQDTDWYNMLNNLNIAFRAHSTVKLSGNGTGSSIGYYELTTDWQLVYSVFGTGAYSANEMLVYARAVAITGANGAKGWQVQLYCNFNENHTNVHYDIVQPGTVVTLGHLRATGGPLTTAAVAPGCTVAQAL